MNQDAFKMLPITSVAEKTGFREDELELYGKYKAKINLEARNRFNKKGKLVLVTAINPTPYGEGKTTVTIGLTDALNHIGKKASAALREPSLGPVFGVKGGATGGGLARVVPSDDINLHFTGDIHAVTSAHNLIAAMSDNYYSQKNNVHFQPRDIFFHRVVDMNDRALRNIIVGVSQESGQVRESKFEITAASELMAVLGLSYDIKELKRRIGDIFIGERADGEPFFVKDLNADNAASLLLKDAIKPNLVQTLYSNPVFIHTGPFANIAHGTNSIIATDLSMRVSDFTVVEAGFGSDLGAEKFFDIVSRHEKMSPPDCVVIVATIRALKHHGGVKSKNLLENNPESVKKGYENLKKHIENMASFNVPVVTAINKFKDDKDDEIKMLVNMLEQDGYKYSITDVFTNGREGAVELAETVVKLAEERKGDINYVYDMSDPVEEKIKKVTYRIYGAYGIFMPKKIYAKLEKFSKWGFGPLPVCIAKTQYSFSDNEKLLGRPKNFNIEVKDVKLSSGAGFLVVYTGNIMTMPGLPEKPHAESMLIDDMGNITGVS